MTSWTKGSRIATMGQVLVVASRATRSFLVRLLFGKRFDHRAGGEEALRVNDFALFVEDDGLDFFLVDIEAAKWHTDFVPFSS